MSGKSTKDMAGPCSRNTMQLDRNMSKIRLKKRKAINDFYCQTCPIGFFPKHKRSYPLCLSPFADAMAARTKQEGKKKKKKSKVMGHPHHFMLKGEIEKTKRRETGKK